jgi:hypothetical protein
MRKPSSRKHWLQATSSTSTRSFAAIALALSLVGCCHSPSKPPLVVDFTQPQVLGRVKDVKPEQLKAWGDAYIVTPQYLNAEEIIDYWKQKAIKCETQKGK